MSADCTRINWLKPVRDAIWLNSIWNAPSFARLPTAATKSQCVYAGNSITRGSTAVAPGESKNSFYVQAYMEAGTAGKACVRYRAEITPLGSNRH